ncbi:MAG: alpha-ketoglutarate-dependent dioxygenase AlkB [Xanthomonadaceae bacterium]|jgi:alkylated DNA repair dioxygenase AlkB|nr:alpha-ketoglutarate-dependent dioxygenase AlkB [Xanthomonadaceae bacterium]
MAECAFERLPLRGGALRWAPAFLDPGAADALLAEIDAEVPWERHHVRIFGREIPAPRLSCWIGDPGAAYTYSRVRFEPRPWTPALARVRQRIEQALDARFNSVLANRYASGADSMGWHADDEPELGPRPVIASLSLGATRRFVLRPRSGGAKVELPLTHGSLLVMAGDTQANWQHALPRMAGAAGLRINLTFRRIVDRGTQ